MFSTSQLVQSVTNRHTAASPKPLEFSPGQVFQGTVLKRYPDNTALVQVGGVQVQARLETDLEPGQKAWLQVQPSSDVITLKVLNASQSGATQEAFLEGLLRSLGVANTKEIRAVVQALLAANLPVSKERVEAFQSIVQRIGMSDAAVDAFLLAVKRNLPVTADTVAGLQAFLSKKTLTQAIQTFLQQAEMFLEEKHTAPSVQPAFVPEEAPLFTGDSVRRLVVQLKEKVANLPLILSAPSLSEEPVTASTGIAPRNTSVLPDLPEPGRTPAEQDESSPSTSGKPTAGSPSIVQEGDSEHASPAPFSRRDVVKPAAPLSTELPFEHDGGDTVTVRHSPPGDEQRSVVSTPQQQLRLEQPSVSSPEMPNREGEPLVPHNPRVEPRGEHPSTLASAADLPSTTGQQGNGQQTPAIRANPILELFHRLGLTHERELLEQALTGATAEQAVHKQAENVKSLLVALTQAPAHAVPAGLREAAEALLQHVTGQQLMLVQPTAHAISQLVMQIPIRTPQGDDTAYVQIEAKRQGGGQLDPENCRLFFHLNLQQIGTTMVDVNIVNRIVNVQIYNDTPWVETLAQQMREGFASQLQEVGYQLSGMRVQKIPETRSGESVRPTAISPLFSSYKGVDIRI
jgi:hypothetical protein